MAYELSIESLVDQVLALPDIQGELKRPPAFLNDAYVRTELKKIANDIRLNAAKEIENYGIIEQVNQTSSSEFEKETAAPAIVEASKFGVGCLPIVGFIFIATWWGAEVLTKLSWQTGVIVLLTVVASGAGVRLFVFYRRQLPSLQKTMTDRYQLDSADDRLAKAKQAADDTVFKAAVAAAATLINEAQRPFYQQNLFVFASTEEVAPQRQRKTVGLGLSEVLSPANEVATETRAKIAQLIETLPGASIGIAGPRGVGKSTLLLSLCTMQPSSSADNTVRVYTTAPVEYESRDFLLHIYASVCRAVLRIRGVPEQREFGGADDAQTEAEPEIVNSLGRIGLVLTLVGLVLTVFGLVLTAAISNVTAANGPLVTTAAPTSGDATVVGPPAPGAPQQGTPNLPRAGIHSNFSQILDLKTGTIVQWGLIALPVGLVLWGYCRAYRRRREIDQYVKGMIGVFFPQYKRPALTPPPPDAGDLVKKSHEAMHGIRFQRSYSSGWSGSLKLPAAFETSISKTLSLAQRQQSLPDLVEEFKEFVQAVTAQYRVIIGIDELDKISSDEKAQSFVNEIKAIFNIPSCFFLISVSESAISSFERRGLAFRDAFDSAFDDILQVKYLTRIGSFGLLSRRTLGLPSPFLALSHSLSAGLPRDLIRVTRAMLTYAREHPVENNLSLVAIALLRAELSNKLHAAGLIAREIPLEPHVTKFMTRIMRIDALELRDPAILTECKLERSDSGKELSDEQKKLHQKLINLELETNCFLYFCVTAAEIFGAIITEAKWNEYDQQRYLDELAEARQGLELSVGVAAFRLDALRSRCALAQRPELIAPDD